MSPREIFANAARWIVRLESVAIQSGGGTGFISNGKVITCGHVVLKQNGWKLALHFHESFGEHRTAIFDNPHENVRGFSDEHSFDYAIFEAFRLREKYAGLAFSNRVPEVGEPVVTLGYPLDDTALTLHQGIISAVAKSGPATMLKLDMSINAGNSGGPLISLVDGAVIGVIARKATGLTKAFRQLINAMEENLSALDKLPKGLLIMGIDHVGVMTSNQAQLKQIALEIERSANVGIGYAVYIDPLRAEPALSLEI